VAKGLPLFRDNDWSEDSARITPVVTVPIEEPEIQYAVRIQGLQVPARKPAEMGPEERIHVILKGIVVASGEKVVP
jgi:hypothetical protein